jgi:DNA-binding CsgD family transcriptional regulator
VSTPTLTRHSTLTRGGTAPGVDALLANAEHEVLVMSRATTMAGDPLGLIRRVHHDNLRHGVSYRVLVPDAARAAPVLGPQLGAAALAGAAIRTVPSVPTDALVIDRSVVVLPADRSASASGMAVFGLPGVVTTTLELFEHVWAAGVSLTASDLPAAAELDPRQLKLLCLLMSGSTDESAAAELGISVRTVRRLVADIMNRLGARSRFQAGAKAVDRGWLMARAG